MLIPPSGSCISHIREGGWWAKWWQTISHTGSHMTYHTLISADQSPCLVNFSSFEISNVHCVLVESHRGLRGLKIACRECHSNRRLSPETIHFYSPTQAQCNSQSLEKITLSEVFEDISVFDGGIVWCQLVSQSYCFVYNTPCWWRFSDL